MARQKVSQVHKRGFGSLTKERRKEISSMGGKAAHDKGTAHKFSSQQAQDAGRLGAKARNDKRKEDRSDVD